MGKHIEEFCDLCGQLLYHSVRSYTVRGSSRWWWHGGYREREDKEFCDDCADIIEYLSVKRKALVKDIRSKLKGKSPAEQMENRPKFTVNAAINLLRSKL